MRAITFFARLLIGLIFLYAGAVKVWDVGGGQWGAPLFARSIANYRLVGGDLAILLSVYLPWLEIAGGLSLVFRRLYAGGLILLTFLALLFAGALGSAVARGLNVDCGCFGSAAATPAAALTRDLLLLAGLIFLIVAERYGPHSRQGYSESLLETRPPDV